LAGTWKKRPKGYEAKFSSFGYFGVFRGNRRLGLQKIFPALQAMVKRGTLNVPVIGVAKSGWSLEQLKARAKDTRVRRRRVLNTMSSP
jgi:glucose-6-phosphate 1-dehydrogenase